MFLRSAAIAMLLFFSQAALSTEISDYTDCAKAGRSDSSSGVPLTKAERIAKLQAEYVRTVSQTERCEKNEQSASSAAAGGAASGGAGGGAAGATQPLSENAGVVDNAINVNSSLESTANTTPGGMIGDAPGYTSSGQEHEKLEDVDNRAVLRSQIKAAADKETDPKMKKILMEKYESLK